MEKNLVLDVHESPSKVKDWILFAIQHVLAMLVACITVPLITGLPIGPTLIAAGIGTLIYILCTKGKSPVYLGSSFAFIAPIAAAFMKGGISGAMTGIMTVGLIYIIVSIIIRLAGKAWLDKLLPPVVLCVILK